MDLGVLFEEKGWHEFNKKTILENGNIVIATLWTF